VQLADVFRMPGGQELGQFGSAQTAGLKDLVDGIAAVHGHFDNFRADRFKALNGRLHASNYRCVAIFPEKVFRYAYPQALKTGQSMARRCFTGEQWVYSFETEGKISNAACQQTGAVQ